MDEFTDACNVLSKHANATLTPQAIKDMASSIDINKDGFIDFNEFLEAFRLVSRKPEEEYDKKLNERHLDEIEKSEKIEAIAETLESEAVT